MYLRCALFTSGSVAARVSVCVCLSVRVVVVVVKPTFIFVVFVICCFDVGQPLGLVVLERLAQARQS